MFHEIGIHAAIGDAGPENLEGQEDQERQKEPGEQSEFQDAPAELDVVGESRLQRWVIVRVDARQAEAVGTGAAVADVEPHGLNPTMRQRTPKRLPHSPERPEPSPGPRVRRPAVRRPSGEKVVPRRGAYGTPSQRNIKKSVAAIPLLPCGASVVTGLLHANHHALPSLPVGCRGGRLTRK